MLMEDEGYVKPASRESRLVMVQLEPRAEKEPRSLKQYKKETKDKNTNKKTKNKFAMQRNFFDHLMEAYCDWEGLHGSSCA